MKYSIKLKLISVYFILLLTINFFIFFGSYLNRKVIINEVGESTRLIGEKVFKRMNQRIYYLVNQFQLIVKTKSVQELLLNSNEKYGKTYPDQLKRDKSLFQKERKYWINNILNNDTSQYLREVYFTNYERQYGTNLFHQIIITNKYGFPVAVSGKWEKDYYGDEDYWQQARNEGNYLNDIIEEKEEGFYNILLIAFKIFDNKGDFGGVIIIKLDIKDIIRESEVISKKYNSTEIEIIDRNHQLIYSTKPYRFFTDVKGKAYYKYIDTKQVYIIYKDKMNNKMISFIHSQGYKFFQGLDWTLVISHNIKEILIPYSKISIQIIATSSLIVIISIILMFLNLRIIIKPLNSLLTGIREIIDGKVNKRVKILNNDEFGEVTTAFNLMLDKILNIEKALRESEERLKLAILGTRAGLWDWNIRSGHIIVNERWAEIIGYKIEEIFPIDLEKFGDLFHPDDLKKSNDLLELHFSGKLDNYECEMRIKHKSGEWVWILSRGKITERDKDGNCIRMTGTIQDITHQKEIENEIKKLNMNLEDRVKERTLQLEQSNAELEAFAYTVSHDLRAPLRSIDGFSRILIEDYYDKLDENLRHYLERISAGSQRMGRLIDEILKLSRATRRKMKWEDVNLSELANEIALTLMESEPGRIVEFKITENIVVKGDIYLLTTVFENLIGNAWKFTKHMEKAIISFGFRIIDNETQYFIKDNGIGFDMRYVDNLFKPFKRLHSEQIYPGSGIGLANVQRVISKHGGRVWAESGGEGKGAMFFFTLK